MTIKYNKIFIYKNEPIKSKIYVKFIIKLNQIF